MTVPVVSIEEEELVAANWTTERSSELVINQSRFGGEELVACVQVLHIVEPEQAPMKAVGSALRNDVDVAGHRIGDFRGCDTLGNIDFGNGFGADGLNVVEIAAH